MSKQVTNNHENLIKQLSPVQYDVLTDNHVFHVVFKKFKKFNEKTSLLISLVENPQITLRYYNAEDLKNENMYLYYESTGGKTPTLGDGHTDCPPEWQNYTKPLTKEELKEDVLQFVKEADCCLSEDSIRKIVRYVPKKKDGTLAKKRVTLINKSKWADHDGLCFALIARNISDTEIEIEGIELYIGEDKFKEMEFVTEAGIRKMIMSSQPALSASDTGSSKQKTQSSITKGILIPGTKIPRFIDGEMMINVNGRSIKVSFKEYGYNSTIRLHLDPIIKFGNTCSQYHYYDVKEYENLKTECLKTGRMSEEDQSIPLEIVLEQLKPLEPSAVLKHMENFLQSTASCWSEEGLIRIIDLLPHKKDGSLMKNRVMKVCCASFVTVSVSEGFAGYAEILALEAKNITDQEVLLRF